MPFLTDRQSSGDQGWPVQRVGEEQRAAARGVGHALGVEPVEEQRQGPGGHGEDGDVAPLHAPGLAHEGIGDLHVADLDQPAEVARQGRPAGERALAQRDLVPSGGGGAALAE